MMLQQPNFVKLHAVAVRPYVRNKMVWVILEGGEAWKLTGVRGVQFPPKHLATTAATDLLFLVLTIDHQQ